MCRIKGLDTSGVAIGTIHDFGQATLPFGYVACTGASVLRAGTYAGLFAKIGTTYGFTDGLHFNLPPAVGNTRIMPGTYTDPVSGAITRTPGQSIGAEAHVITGAQTGSHNHSVNDPGHGHALKGGGNAIVGIGVDGQPVMGATVFNGFYNSIVGGAGTGVSINATAAAAAHNNMQPTLVVGNVGIAYI